MAPPPGLRIAALRALNPAACIPDDAGLISYRSYETALRQWVARSPVLQLEELEPQRGKLPILHVWAGEGKDHHFSLSGVHSNETHSMLVDLAEIEAICRNPDMLRDLGITWHWFHLDPEGIQLSDKGLIGQPEPHRYVAEMHRTLALKNQVAWGFPGTSGGRTFSGPFTQGVRALKSFVDRIYADGEQIISIRHGHNEHVAGSDALFYLPEPYLNEFGPVLEAAAEARDLSLKDVLPESSAQQKATGTKATFTAYPVEEIFNAGGGNDPEHYIAGIADQYKKRMPVFGVFEPVKWSPKESNPELQGLTAQQADAIVADTLGPLPRLTAQARRIFDAYVEHNPDAMNDPLIEGAVSAADWDTRPADAPAAYGGSAVSSSCLSEDEAFAKTVTALFYRAARAGQVVRGLKQIGGHEQLQDELSTERDRIIDEIFERGRLQPVSVVKAVRAMADVGLLTLDQALVDRQAR